MFGRLSTFPVSGRCGLGVILLAAVGCGPAKAPVHGRISYDGEPVLRGRISFEPADGHGPARESIIEGGQYRLTDELAPFEGKKIVRIYGAKTTGRKIEVGLNSYIDDYRQYIPTRFNDQSSLTCELAGGKLQEMDFDLRSRP